MKEENIESLREALRHSPENIPLRLILADSLLSASKLDEAEAEFNIVLQQSDNLQAKKGLAITFFRKANYAACNVILEEIIESGSEDTDTLVLYAKGLIKEGSYGKAGDIYRGVLEDDPNFFDEELDSELRQRIGAVEEVTEEEIDNRFIQKPSINFSNVGGMLSVKKEIDLKIIKPMAHPDLYKAYGKKIGGGILLYGPPGCGKTFIAKATAGEINAKFINISLNNILDMWIGNSEKNLHEVFELARRNTPCVLFIDEIDALGASRSDMKQSAGRHIINQFLQELDGVDNNNDGILILGATNTPWNLDPAFKRPGRFDRIIFVPPPDMEARESILKIKLEDKPTESIDYTKVAKRTDKYSGADIDALVDITIEQKLESSFKDGVPKPITTTDLVSASKKHKTSVAEWFQTAKNFAMFANESGLYDEILSYLKIKK